MNIGIVVSNLAEIFAMIAVGFFVGRTRLLSDRASADFTAFLMKVTLPCTVFSSMIREYDSSLIRDSLLIFVLGIVFFGGGMLLNLRVSRWLRVPEAKRGVWVLSVSLCNIGFMGFPLIQAIFGDDGLFLASIMNLAYNMVAFSLGAKIICGNGEQKAEIQWKKILFTNVHAAVVRGLICFLGQITPPEQVMDVVGAFAGITTPLSMALIGRSLAGGKRSEVFRDREVLSITGMRLIVMPLLAVLLLHTLPLPAGSILTGVGTVILAMPCPSVSMMLAQQYGADVELAARAIFLSSLCCIVTIPLMMLLI
ncbi:MAG: AEC family transporter [Lachnospiraceae bacterium]|nr:AEC family transporter [Lachnospiraceae bacterium]